MLRVQQNLSNAKPGPPLKGAELQAIISNHRAGSTQPIMLLKLTERTKPLTGGLPWRRMLLGGKDARDA